MSDEELKTETEHVLYWENCLNSLSKHFEIILNFINLHSNIQKKRLSFSEKIKTNYQNESKPFKKEPSHIYVLTEIYFDLYSYLGKNMNSETKKLLSKTIKEIIKNLADAKNETCADTLKLINKCKQLILNIKNLEQDYQKAKIALDDAMIYQKKIKNQDKYTYNVAKKEKADLQLSEKIKEMEKIKNPLETNKKKLLESKTKLNSIIKNNFEIIVSVCFKQLSNYYQCLFLIINQRIDILINLRGKLDDIITQLSNLVFDLNDYSEKKFGETVLALKTEGLNIYSSTELINKSSMKQLIEISNNIINYVKIFLICLRYRKKIMKIFLETVSKIIDFENDNIKQFTENKKELLIQLDNLKMINNNSQRFLRNLISKEKTNEIIKEIKSISSFIKNYIEFVRNEYYTFLKNWEPYEEKILERQKLSMDFLNEIKELKNSNKKINQQELIARNEKKKSKLKNVILAGLDFIQRNVLTTREKDKNEMMKLESTLEKMFINCQNMNDEYVSHSENELNNAAMSDIFEECKIFIIKYFNRFKIQNYDNFLERMKIKLLMNTDLSEGKLGKIIYGSIKNGIDNQIELSKNDSSFDDLSSDNHLPSEYYFQKSRTQSVYLKSNPRINPFINASQINDNNKNNITLNKSINDKSFNKSNISNKITSINPNGKNKYRKSLFNNGKNNINNENNNISNENNNIKNEIENEKDEKDDVNNINDIEIDDELNQISNTDILNELENEDKLEFLTNNQLSKYTEAIDPYSNIKEDELDRLLNMKKESTKNELEEGEEILDSFSCSLSSKFISRGTFYITTKKVEYNSSFINKQQIIIPLEDIISIDKKTSLGIDNSIEIKTEKVTVLFTSFISRDHCFLILQNQFNKVKEETKKNNKVEDDNEEKDGNGPEQKYLKKKRFKAKQITKMLEEIEFHKKIEQYTKERMELFSKKYYDGKKGLFLPNSEFQNKITELTLEDFPLFIPFKVLCKVSTKLEEYKSCKGFFESLFLERGDTEVKFEDSPEFSKNLPPYFDDGDFVMNLFSQFNKADFESFLNDIPNWNDKYEGNCHANHKVKQIPFGPSRVIMKNRYIAYFISPTCLIFDDMAYATGFQFSEKFMPLFRYKFDCNIKFNEHKCKFEFKTKMVISYITVFFGDFWLKSAVRSKSGGECEELVRGEIIDKLKESYNIYINKFKVIFDRSTDETFQRKIDLKQNMITGEVEEEIIDGVEDEEENKEEGDKKETEENQDINKNEQKENNSINQKINEFIDKYKLYMFIGIVSITFLEIINSFFNKGAGSFAITTIFNLIILASIFYLFKFN